MKKILCGMAAAITIASCAAPVDTSHNNVASNPKIVSANTDAKSSGDIAVLSINNGVCDTGIMATSSDPVVKYSGGTLFLLDRKYGSVTLINQDTIGMSGVRAQIPMSSASDDPNDLCAVNGSKAYVTLYNKGCVALLNLDNKTLSAKSIDVSRLADTVLDTSMRAYPDHIVMSGGFAYVDVQQYNSALTYFYGIVVKIDTATDSIVKTIHLNKTNPMSISVYGSKVYVSCKGEYGVLDGDIESIDTGSGNLATVTTESELNGDLGNILCYNGYLFAISGNWPNGYVSKIDLTSSSIVTKLIGGITVANDLTSDGSKIYVANGGTSNPGIYSIDPILADTCKLFKTGTYPPVSLTFVPGN